MQIVHDMGWLHRVELAGLADGRRGVRLFHRGGETRAVYREGAGGGEALLAAGERGGGLEEVARTLAGDGVASLLLEGEPDRAAVHAALAFLRQRGARRFVVVAEGGPCEAVVPACAGAEAVALVDPGAWPAGDAPPDVPALIVARPDLELPARRASSRFARSTVAIAAGAEVPPLLRTFVHDALRGAAGAIEA